MATGSHQTTVDPTGNPVRVVTNPAVDSGAEQQVVTLASSTGAILGESGSPLIVSPSGTVVVSGVVDASGSVVAVTGTVAVSGPLTDAQLRATPVPVSGTVTVSDGSGPITVDGTVAISGTVATQETCPGTGAQTNVASAATDTTILASNANRRGASVWNDSTATLYLLLAAGTASATVCTVKVRPDAYYEVPFGYTGIVKGIWSAANGAARVTEWT